MKNKKFRFAVAIVLVVAMTFTIAGCGKNVEKPDITPLPTETPAPTPTLTPEVSTPNPTTKPSEDKKDEVSHDFGISLKEFGGVYGTDHENAESEEISPGYFLIKWDKENTADQHYALKFDIEISSDDKDYEFTIKIPSANTDGFNYPNYTCKNPVAMNAEIGASANYKDAREAIIEGLVCVVYDDYMIIQLENAGEYEFSSEVTITDKAKDFGGWDIEDRDTFEMELSGEMEIKKQKITMEIAPAVIEESEFELRAQAAGVPDDGSSNQTFSKYQVQTVQNLGGETVAKRIFFPSTFKFDGNEIGLKYELDFIKESKVGTYAVEIAEEYLYNGKTYEDIDDLNEDLANHEIVAVADTAVHVISSYDYIEIADVLTSIAEIDYSSAGITGTADGFFADPINLEVQLPLAVKRYNALSREQKAFFDTFAQVDGFINVTRGNVGAFLGVAIPNEDIDYITGEIDNTDAIAYLEFMNFACEVYADYLIYDAFDKYAEEVELPKEELAPAEWFNVKNTNHIKAFNLVDKYFNALSDENQEVIEEKSSIWYESYISAKNLIEESEIDGVEQLIVGAYQAYIKALANGVQVVYQYTNLNDEIATSWGYIYSEETQKLTAQAKEAFDGLSDYQREYMEKMSAEILIVNHYNPQNVTCFASGKNTVYNALEKLVDMNKMIETMVEITQYLNLPDYGTKTLLNSRLNALVFGGEEVAKQGLYFPTYTDAVGAVDYRYAMQDIMNAPTRNYDAIIAEYQEWMDYVVAIEDYKTTALLEFVSQIKFEAKQFDEDDYSSYAISVAGDGDNNIAGIIIAAIMSEDIKGYINNIMPGMTDITGILDNTGVFDKTAVIISVDDVKPFIYKGFLEDKDNFDDIYESYDDFMDLDEIIDSYIDAVLPKDEM